jgi:rhodanese-related sulfurtransferase/polyisoprenoid-binding protein YceI
MDPSADFKVITVKELESWRAQGRDLVLIDILPEDHYRRMHLPGAENACVYQVIFVGRIEDLVQDKDRMLVLYGFSERSRDAVTAADKLVRAGYRSVFTVAGGLKAWHEMGGPLVGEAPESVLESPGLVLKNRLYKVDAEASVILWTGRNPNTHHFGTLKVSEGSISVHEGTMTGSFTLDMTSIRNSSLAGDPLQPILEGHLASDDFFFVERFPTAQFTIESAKVLEEPTLSAPNLEVSGVLEVLGLKGIINFAATLNNIEDEAIVAEAHFDIDRTRWGIIYGSSRFFDHLGMHLVFDLISVQLRIVAR